MRNGNRVFARWRADLDRGTGRTVGRAGFNIVPALAALLVAACQTGGAGSMSGPEGRIDVTLSAPLAGRPSGLFVRDSSGGPSYYRFEDGLVHLGQSECRQAGGPVAVNGGPAAFAYSCEGGEGVYLVRIGWDGSRLTIEQASTAVSRDQAGRISGVYRANWQEQFAISDGTCTFLAQRYESVSQEADGSVTEYEAEGAAADNEMQISCRIEGWTV